MVVIIIVTFLCDLLLLLMLMLLLLYEKLVYSMDLLMREMLPLMTMLSSYKRRRSLHIWTMTTMTTSEKEKRKANDKVNLVHQFRIRHDVIFDLDSRVSLFSKGKKERNRRRRRRRRRFDQRRKRTNEVIAKDDDGNAVEYE